jgi:hypothetical protein
MIGEDKGRRIAWNYDGKEEATEMIAEATVNCRLFREQAEKEGRKEERNE